MAIFPTARNKCSPIFGQGQRVLNLSCVKPRGVNFNTT